MSFINITKYAEESTLVSLYSDAWRIEKERTHATDGQMKGSISFNRIHPSAKDNGIKNVYLEFDAQFTITKAATATIRVQNFNDAIYDCNVSYNGNSGYINQPYLNSIIKRCFDKDVFIEQATTRHDKYVDVILTPNDAGTSVDVVYHCMTPIYHEIFEAKEITGLNDLNVRFNYNLFNLFKTNMFGHAGTAGDPAGAGNGITAIVLKEPFKVKILYDEVRHEIPQDVYTMQVPHFEYFESHHEYTIDSSATSENKNSFTINVTDITSCPLRCYLIQAPRIRDETYELCNVVPSRFVSSKWDLDNKYNAFLSNGQDGLLSNYVNSKNAGLKSEFMTWAGRKSDGISASGIPIDPIIGINTLDTTKTFTNTSDNWRCGISGTIEHDQLKNCTTDRTLLGIAVYEYPGVLQLGTGIQSGVIFTLDRPAAQLEEIEMDDNDYVKSLEDAGILVGGSKFTDFFRNLWNKIKSGRFISKALNWVGNDSKKYNNLLSMIPVVGQYIPQVQDIASKAGKIAETAGLGTNLF